MAFTTIDDPEAHFQIELWTGTGSENARTLDSDTNMQPDLVWTKSRSDTHTHMFWDAVRGATKRLESSNTDAESTAAQGVKSFDSDGFTLGTDNGVNESSETYVAWCWKAGGSTSSNTTGDITSTVSVNSTSKFSIVSYTGNGTANQTVGHSLGVKPDLIIIKNRDRSVYWPVINPRFVSTSDPNMLYLNVTQAEADDTNIQGSNAHSSTIFGVDDYTGVNVSTEKQIAYCWASVQGYSKFGTYTGNGNADGTFVFCGFRPALVMAKYASPGGGVGDWNMYDNKRKGYNAENDYLAANATSAENSSDNQVDLLSNGFKWRATDSDSNESGSTYVYMAFAEAPFVNSSGVPCNAR